MEPVTWLLPRFLLVLLATLLGAGVGLVAEMHFGLSWLAEILGVMLGVSAVMLFDLVRAHRLMKWLREKQGNAPRDAGLWGELGYRIERALLDRERVIERERLQLAQFLSAIEASPNGVLMLDATDHIQWCNRVAADHFALDPQRDLLQRVTNLVRMPAFVAHLHSANFEELLLLPNVRGQVTLAVHVRAYGEGMRLVLSQDITERERADAMRRDFVANVSHEIRTPLTVLSGFIETQANLPLTEPERRRVLTLMQAQADRMQSLVADLLTLAQLEGSPRPGNDSWVSLDVLLRRVEADAQALSAGRHQLRMPSPTGASLAGFEPELFSAVSNLVSNAIRYTPAGGRIEVAWRVLADGSGEICVSDTGPGIAREHLPRLTERFYRVDGSRSRDTGGTGLGLAIVKHVLQRHGGSLLIESEIGQGSRFKLQMPAARIRVDVVVPTPASTTSVD